MPDHTLDVEARALAVLVQQLAQQKAASAWMASRASESENAKLQMLARMIRQTDDTGGISADRGM